MKISEILDGQAKRSEERIQALDRQKKQEKIRKKQAEVGDLQRKIAQTSAVHETLSSISMVIPSVGHDVVDE